jgi:hypothetical protein
VFVAFGTQREMRMRRIYNCGLSGCTMKGKEIPLQVWRGPEGSSRLMRPDVETIGTLWWLCCQPHAPPALTPPPPPPGKYSWYSFLLEAEWTPRPYYDRIWLYNIFPHYITNGTVLENGYWIKTNVLISPTSSVRNISHSKKKWVEHYSKYVLVFT